MNHAGRFRLVWTPFLTKSGGAFRQAVGFVCPSSLGSGGEVSLWIGRKQYTSSLVELLSFPDQEGCYFLRIARPARPMRCRAVWRTAEGKTFRDTLLLEPARPVQVHTVFDFCWTTPLGTTADQGYDRKAMIQRLLDHFQTADKLTGDPRLVMKMPFYHLESALMDEELPVRIKERLVEYIGAGRVTWDLVPSLVDDELSDAESLCQLFYHARYLAESSRRPVPRTADISGMTAASASLGMAVTAAGGTMILMGGDEEALPLRVPPLFRWKLPDESMVLVHYLSSLETSLLPPVDWPWDHWLSIQRITDAKESGACQTLCEIEWIQRHFDFPRYRLGTMDDYADALIGRHGKKIPIVEGEFIEVREPVPTGDPRETAAERSRREDDTLADILRMLEGGFFRQFATSRQWADTSKVCRQLIESDGAGILDTGWHRFSTTRKARPTIPTGKHVLLFNALSWPRGGLVRLPESKLPAGPFALLDPTTKGVVHYERRRGYVEFIAPMVPACGYLALDIRETAGREQPGLFADWQERTLTLHTCDQSLMYNRVGGLARWHDRARSYQWCSDMAKHPLGSFLYERPDRQRLLEYARSVYRKCPPEWMDYLQGSKQKQPAEHGLAALGPARITSEVGPFSARITVEADGPARPTTGQPFSCRTSFTLYRGRPELYIHMALSSGPRDPGPEAGYAFFPFAGDEPCVLVNRILHTFQPSEYLAGRSNAARMFVHHGLRMEYTHAGINFFPLHTPMLGLGGPAAWRFDPAGSYKTGHVYAALMTTPPGLSPPTGKWSYDFVLQPTGNDQWDGGLARGGAELFRPLLASVVGDFKGHPGQSLLSVHPDKVHLLALQPATFAPGLMLRLWNSDVEPITARINLPVLRRGQELFGCDLLERPRRKIQVNKAGFANVKLGPQRMVTLLLAESRKRTMTEATD